jgi:hypothetical protein
MPACNLAACWTPKVAQGALASAVHVSEPRDHGDENSPPHLDTVTPSVFAGFRFPPEVIMLAVRLYLRFGLLPL